MQKDLNRGRLYKLVGSSTLRKIADKIGEERRMASQDWRCMKYQKILPKKVRETTPGNSKWSYCDKHIRLLMNA